MRFSSSKVPAAPRPPLRWLDRERERHSTSLARFHSQSQKARQPAIPLIQNLPPFATRTHIGVVRLPDPQNRPHKLHRLEGSASAVFVSRAITETSSRGGLRTCARCPSNHGRNPPRTIHPDSIRRCQELLPEGTASPDVISIPAAAIHSELRGRVLSPATNPDHLRHRPTRSSFDYRICKVLLPDSKPVQTCTCKMYRLGKLQFQTDSKFNMCKCAVIDGPVPPRADRANRANGRVARAREGGHHDRVPRKALPGSRTALGNRV